MLQTQFAWYDRTGKQLSVVNEKFGMMTALGQDYSLSPDGNKIAMSLQGSSTDIWVYDIPRGVLARLTFGPVGDAVPVWSPDGKWIAYYDNNNVHNGALGIKRRPAAGGSEETLLTAAEASPGSANPGPIYPSYWSRDGKYLIYTKGAIGTHTQIWALPLFGDRKPVQLVPAGTFQSNYGSLSPDGKWLTYASDESGRYEVYVVPFLGSGGKWQVSNQGGNVSYWSSDGKEIFYLGLDQTMQAVSVNEQDGQLQLGAPHTLFKTSTLEYNVTPDAQKFLIQLSANQGSEPFTLVVNWAKALKQ
jgi:Tol biopolymer transport system component